MKLTFGQKAAYGIGAVGKDMVYALSASYVMYYYQDILHLPATFVGLILMIARVFDALNDPFMGVLVAKTKTRFGRFRPWLFSGSVLTETVFAWPGVGKYIVDGINNSDYAVVQGGCMLVAVISVLMNLLVDLLYGSLDPRIRYS